MKPEEHDFQAEIITFSEVFDLSHKLSLRITDKSLSFDIVVGIARGGVTPARLLSDFLNIGSLTSLQIRHYEKGAKQLDKTEIIDPVDVDIKEKNVLLVDDINDSGKTLKAAVKHVLEFNPALLKTAVIHEKESSAYNCDFVGKTLEEWKWFVYEWAVTEDILEFLKRDDMLDAGEEKALNHLKEKYRLEPGVKLLRSVMQLRENYKE